MRFFEKFRKEPTVSDAEVSEIRARVQEMRKQVGYREVELADLFALLGEDERPALRQMSEVRRPEVERVWPNEVPDLPRTPEEAVVPRTTYGDWELLRRKGVVTLP